MVSVWILTGLGICLSAGCASSPVPNRKVYDRYAELVAARSREPQSPSAQRAPVSHPVASPAESLDRRPLKTTPVSNFPVAAPAQPVAKPLPTKAPPVAVIAPKPVEKALPEPAKPSTVVLSPAKQPEPVVAPPEPMVAPVQTRPQTPEPSVPAVSVPSPAPAPVVVPAEVAVPVPTPADAPAESSVPAATSSPDGVAYQLKVSDVVQVYLRGIPMSDQIEDVIDENGKISLPLINEIQAAGMTASELERNIRKTYLDQDIYRNITVNVVVPMRYYFIQGEIQGPGRFQLMSATRVSQAIAGAGGYTEFASGQVVIKRGGKIFKTIRNSRRLERTPDDDILLEPDDIIEVRRSLW
jgi:protein involved in polysaccharide export with SLBB domain